MKRLLTSCFGLGWLPVAPGTWGSLPPALFFGLLWHLGLGVWGLRFVMVVMMLSAGALCVVLTPAVTALMGRKDPGEIVVDEVAGQAVVFCAVPGIFWETAGSGQIWLAAGVGFLLFRFFDITKLWPVCRLEKLPAGWGVLADDLFAGFYALLVWTVGIHWIAI